MAYRIELLLSAARELADLPQPAQRRVRRVIGSLADDPRPRGAIVMKGPDRIWRVRVGDYRILYSIHDDVVLVVVVRIRHRKDAYR